MYSIKKKKVICPVKKNVLKFNKSYVKKKYLFFFKKKIFSNHNIFIYLFLTELRVKLYNICIINIKKNKLNSKFKIKNNKYVFKIKKNDKLLLLNIFLNKKKILKPNTNHIKKPNNKLISIKFIIFFLKKIFVFKEFSSFILFFKIKKFTKESKLKNRKFYIYNTIFSRILKLYILCSKLLNLTIKIKSVYNKSHSIRNLKIKKKRRRKRK